jgi:hypothetical protein
MRLILTWTIAVVLLAACGAPGSTPVRPTVGSLVPSATIAPALGPTQAPTANAIESAQAAAKAAALGASPSASPELCRVWTRFVELRTAVGPIVGDCLENEHPNPDNGDIVQRTTGGLLALRCADKLFAFTDGLRSWVRSNDGQVHERPNADRYDWEAKTPGCPPTPTPSPAPRAEMPARDRFALVAANGKLYAIGGLVSPNRSVPQGYQTLARVDEYDPATNRWTQRAPMPTQRSSLSAIAMPNGHIYAMGGCCDHGRGDPATVHNADVEEYDPAADRWTKRASMPTGRIQPALVLTGAGHVLAIGGYHGPGEAYLVVEEYDPATDRWTSRPRMPSPPGTDWSAWAALNGRVYVQFGVVHPIGEYDPAANRWRTIPGPGTPRPRYNPAMTARGATIVLAGGSSRELLGDVDVLDVTSGAWTRGTPLPTKRSFAAAAAIGDRLYVAGGSSDTAGAPAGLPTFEEVALPSAKR